MLMTTGAAVLATHCCVFGFEVISILHRVACAVWHGSQGQGKSNEHLEAVEAAVWDARIKQYRSSSRACMHIGAICTFGQMLHLRWNDHSHSRWPFVISMAAWLMHLVISSNILQLNRVRSRVFLLVMYLMCSLWVFGYPGDCQNALILSSVTISVHFAVATFFVDFQIAVPAQSVLSLVETWNAWKRDPQSVHIFFHQLTVLAFILVLAGLMEFNSRSRIALLINSESMVFSFRRVLRGVCDGEILLDSKLRISGNACCLQTLLMTSDSDFGNKSFEDLLVEDERERFRSFMSERKQAVASDISAPPCLRVSLKRMGIAGSTSSACPRVGVDLFHVPHMLGEETYHLIALREDWDSRSPLEIIGADGDGSYHSHPRSPVCNERKTVRSSPLSDSSVSQVSGNSLLQICKELKEMTLLVDATTPLLDMEQAHLSFVRRPDSETDSTMPSLRRLVQPTDWGTIRSQLVSFAATGSREREVLKMKLRLQDDCKRCLEARRVYVSAFLPPNGESESTSKLCLQLERFKVVRPSQKQRSELQGVYECQSEGSDQS